MRLMTQKSVMNLLIGKNIARTSSVQITDPTNSTTYIADGEVVVCDASGTVLNTTTVLNKKSVFLVQGQGATKPLIWSDEIFLSGVRAFNGKAYTAPTVQIDYVGFNPVTSTGNLDVINDNDYEVHLFDLDSTTFGTLGYSKYGFYTSDSSATLQEVGVNLTESLFTNTRDLVFPSVTIEMVTNGTFTALANNATVVNGSINITSTAHGLAVGDLVRIGGTTTSIAVYEVDTVPTANTFTINYPYQGTSGTVLAANIGKMTVVTSIGIRITGKTPYFVAPNLTTYHVNRWKTTIMRGGSTVVSNQQNATEGNGTYEQISEIEYFLIGNEGFTAREGVIPNIPVRANVEATGTYSIINLNHVRIEGGTLMNPPFQYKQLMIAFNKLGGFIANSQANTATVTSVEGVLEAWLSTFPSITI